jgi:hypothetical protein
MTEYALIRIPQYHLYKGILGEYDPNKDYVGAENDWKAKYIPKRLKISRVDFNPSAYIHDCDYFIGDCVKCKEEADERFHTNMIHACIESGPYWIWGTDWVRKEIGKLGADAYYFAVDKFGDSAFNFNNECKHLKATT